MPLTKSGQEVLSNYQKQYGKKKGREYFYASINKGVPGSSEWHKKRSKEGEHNNEYSRALKG